MKKIVLVFALILMAGCSTMQPPRYSVSVDNVQELKKYSSAEIFVTGLTKTASFNPNCRLMGPIEPADGVTIPQFIENAFNDEFKMAGVYSESKTQITGDVTRIDFSSTAGLTNGYWDISLALQSSNGNTLDVSSRYEFKSGFDAITACNATADALTPAVQDLINKTVTDIRFVELL